jgi:carboxyl-terminal processing protease
LQFALDLEFFKWYILYMFGLSKKRIIVFFSSVIVIFAVFGLGFWTGKSSVVCEVCQPQDINFSLFWEAYQELRAKYVDPAKFDVQKIIYGAVSGMVKSLGDPYTVFFPPDDSKRFLEDVRGTFEGLGMEVGVKNGQLQVVSPLEGTPAQKAGFRPGDKILAINGTSTATLSLEEAVNLMRGPKGTSVTLTIFRDEWNNSKEITVVRDVISIPSLEWKLMDDNIAYVHLYHFSENASPDFQKAALEILNSPAQRIILDLRNNPGGYLEVAQEIAGWFLERGESVVIEDFGNGKEKSEYKADGNAALERYPLVVLINEGSASGAEILAGALRDDRNIKLIGDKSFGKGSVQEMDALTDGSSLKITIARWLTPSGKTITDVGLEPDVKVEMTDKDYQENKDPQLDKAVEIVKGL